MNNQSELIDKLKLEIPEFLEYFDIYDENPYIVLGDLGIFIENIHNSIYKIVKYGTESKTIKNDLLILGKIFKYLNKIYNSKNENIENIIDVSIWELLVTLQYGYNISKDYMSESMYLDFIISFPFEKYKLNWDTEKLYSKKDIDNLL